MTAGLAYYSDCRGDPMVLQTVRLRLDQVRGERPLACITLAPVAWPHPRPGDTFQVLALERGYLTMFRQQLAALEALDTDVAFMVEHDVLYHPSHFHFVPPRTDTFYYNQHTWRVDRATGQALFYYCSQVSGLCASRELLVAHYRARVAHVEAHGFERRLGFEPGTNTRARALDGRTDATWMSAGANVDIKTAFCLTPGRWDQEQFRNKNTCLGWQMADAVPGWGVTKGRATDFLADVAAGWIGTAIAGDK